MFFTLIYLAPKLTTTQFVAHLGVPTLELSKKHLSKCFALEIIMYLGGPLYFLSSNMMFTFGFFDECL